MLNFDLFWEEQLMESVFKEAIELSRREEPFAIATVVHTKGSTPQKPGSKLLVRQDGSAVGTLGGGCVEGDIWFAAKEILRNGSGPEYRDYYLNEEIAARDGLVCGGTMYFFIEPVREAARFAQLAGRIVDAYGGGSPLAVATLIKSPEEEEVGNKLIMLEDGAAHGTVGRPQLDGLAEAKARELMEQGKCAHMTTQQGDELFIEAYTSPATLILMGGGHISKSVAPLAKMLGLRLFVLDDRREFANLERFPDAEAVAVAGYAHGLENFPVNKNTAIVIATRGHNFDDLALESAARSDAGYVGLVGSKRKVILIYEELLKRGLPLERIENIHAPIGMDIKARTPAEIAISIMAEVVQWRLGGTGQPMMLPKKYLRNLAEKVHTAKAKSLSHAD